MTMVATDPRIGATAIGAPNGISGDSAYFSLPDFTGDSHLPEATVKIVDASHSPALRGTFRVFYAPLLHLDDHRYDDGGDRTNPNVVGANRFCGGVDTSAFSL